MKYTKNKAKRYKAPAKPQKKRMSFEKRVLLQSIISAMLLVYCLIISGTDSAILQKEYIHRAVNISDSKKDVKNMFSSLFNITKTGIDSLGESLGAISDKIDSGFGKDGSDVVRASPAVYPPAPETSTVDNSSSDSEAEPEENKTPQFRMPAEGRISSPYGARVHPIGKTNSIHYGIDIAGNNGDCVISALPGTVDETGYDDGLGNYIKVRHSGELLTVYGHLSEILIKKGESVDENTRIGSIGSTGAATGPHLHFEVRLNGACVDPAGYLPQS